MDKKTFETKKRKRNRLHCNQNIRYLLKRISSKQRQNTGDIRNLFEPEKEDHYKTARIGDF